MFCKINSASVFGVDMLKVNVEVDISDGLPSFDMVGLLNSEVRESRERVRTAIKNQGIALPPKRITINLSPVDVRKTGNYFDLSIAVGILKCLGIIFPINLEDTLIIGELSLNGKVNSTNGILSIVSDAKGLGFKRCIVPKDNSKEGGIIEGIEVYGVDDLKDAIALINGEFKREAAFSDIKVFYENASKREEKRDFKEVYGQEAIKRAAVIAACGMHHLLMIGPPGTGKSMIASRMSTILPKPEISECIEITKIHSVAGKLKEKSFLGERPFRAPHHTITKGAMVGGGKIPEPGEITLAHRGVLFLDELAEFRREAIDALRQPLENKKVIISRTSGVYEFPAGIMLVAATNPCKCGYYPDRNRCNCSEADVKKYFGKISGPILDRIDICVNAPLINPEDIDENSNTLSSKEMLKMVELGRKKQKDRYGDVRYNSELTVNEINRFCILEESAREMLNNFYKSQNLSMRAYYKIIKVARTIADIDDSEIIMSPHIAEAVNYRMF